MDEQYRPQQTNAVWPPRNTINKSNPAGITTVTRAQLENPQLMAQRPGHLEEIYADNPWMLNKGMDEPISSFHHADLGLEHLRDELHNATRPNSDLPDQLRIRPESLTRMSMSQASQLVGKINKYRDNLKVEADAAKAMNPATFTHKEYPETGMKWVELKAPEDVPAGYSKDKSGNFLDSSGNYAANPNLPALEDALKYEGDTMGHCVGSYCDDVFDGSSKIYSLRDARGEPHVTIETNPKRLDWLSGEMLDDYKPGSFQDYREQMDRENGLENMHDYVQHMLPGLHEQLSLPVITQIKGKGNKKPVDKYLPYVQDFVKSNKWSHVGDIENTDLLHRGDLQYHIEDNKVLPGVAPEVGLAALDRAKAANALPEYMTYPEATEALSKFMPSPEEQAQISTDLVNLYKKNNPGMAKGGAVADLKGMEAPGDYYDSNPRSKTGIDMLDRALDPFYAVNAGLDAQFLPSTARYKDDAGSEHSYTAPGMVQSLIGLGNYLPYVKTPMSDASGDAYDQGVERALRHAQLPDKNNLPFNLRASQTLGELMGQIPVGGERLAAEGLPIIKKALMAIPEYLGPTMHHTPANLMFGTAGGMALTPTVRALMELDQKYPGADLPGMLDQLQSPTSRINHMTDPGIRELISQHRAEKQAEASDIADNIRHNMMTQGYAKGGLKVKDIAEEIAKSAEKAATKPASYDMAKDAKIRLYRASPDDYVTRGTSFTEDAETARAYQDNPGFGGSEIYSTRINPKNVLDLSDEEDQWTALSSAIGEEIEPSRYAYHFARSLTADDSLTDKLAESGVDWIKFRDDFPEGSKTWIPVSDKAIDNASENNYLFKPKNKNKGGSVRGYAQGGLIDLVQKYGGGGLKGGDVSPMSYDELAAQMQRIGEAPREAQTPESRTTVREQTESAKLLERLAAATPLEQDLYKLSGMEPGLDRAAIWPVAGSREKGNLQLAVPGALYGTAKYANASGAAARGVPVGKDEAVDAAMNMIGMNAPLGIATAAASGPGEVILGSFGSAIKEFPQLKKLAPYLTDEEKALFDNPQWRKQSDNTLNIYKELPPVREMATVAKAGGAKKGWYKDSYDAIQNIFENAEYHDDPERFTALLAALSPQTSVESNLRNALATWKNWLAAGRPQDPDKILKVMGDSVEGNKGIESVLGAWRNNSFRALTSPDAKQMLGTTGLSGPKVQSFFRNLAGDFDEVTNDAWMAKLSSINQSLFGGQNRASFADKFGNVGIKGPGYLAQNAKQRQAAELLGWDPAEVQETGWSFGKTLSDLAGQPNYVIKSMENSGIAVPEMYRGLPVQTAESALRGGYLTDEAIGGTPAFGDLMHVPEYRDLLTGAGYSLPERSTTVKQYTSPYDRISTAPSDLAKTQEGRDLIMASRRIDKMQRRSDAYRAIDMSNELMAKALTGKDRRSAAQRLNQASKMLQRSTSELPMVDVDPAYRGFLGSSDAAGYAGGGSVEFQNLYNKYIG